MSIGNLIANLSVNSKDFTKGLADAKNSASSFAGGLIKTLGPIGTALAAAWGGAASVSGYKDALEVQRKLSAVLTATGGAAGVTADQINDYASELQATTNFEGDATVGAAAMMARFSNIKGEMFFSVMDAAADLASVMSMDLPAATALLGKAMDNPSEGLAKLAKAGMAFTEAEEEQLKSLQASGDLIGAQGMIMDKVAGKFGGAAKAMADPWTQAKNAIGDVGEMFGSLLLPAIDLVSAGVTTAVTFLATYGETFKAIGIEAAAWLSILGDAWVVYATSLWAVAEPIINAVGELFQWLFGDIIAGGSMSFQEMGIEALVVLTNLTGIIEVTAMEWGLYFTQFGNDTAYWFTDKLPVYVAWFADNFSDIMFTAVDYAATIFINLGTNIRNMWSAVWEFIKGNGFEFDWTPLTEGAASAISSLPDIPDRVATQFETAMTEDIAGLTAGLGASMDKQRAELTAGLEKSRTEIAKRYNSDAIVPPGGPDDEGDTPAGAKTAKSAAAQDFGSAAAYSTIAAAFVGNKKDPAVAAIEKQTAELKKSAKENKAPPVVVVDSLGGP